jgi:predicted MFS family arabinose efflux permease
MNSENSNKKGWQVTFAALSINLALGILYAWSVLKEAILQSINSGKEGAFAWDLASLNDPYATCVLAFAFSMTFAGKLQDSKGPSFTAKIGAILVGTGFIIASLSTNYFAWLAGFGILGGMGIGFGYSATTPAALKWFSSAKTGMIAGLVVSGFGLAPIYIAPLASFLVSLYGVQATMLIFGISFLILIYILALFLKNPPAGFIPQVVETKVKKNTKLMQSTTEDFSALAMLKTLRFYMMWLIFFIGAGAGLMVISNISGIAKASMGKASFIAVAIMAIGNASGRVVAGIVSDKIAKSTTLFIIILFQSTLMFLAAIFVNESSPVLLIILFATFIGFNYGTNLSLFPSFTKSFWGMKNFGLNYGILMSAWGIGGFVFSRLSQTIIADTGSFFMSYIIAGSALFVSMFLTIVLLDIKSMN